MAKEDINRLRMKIIVDVVCKYYSFPKETLIEMVKSRKMEIVKVRHMISYFGKEKTGLSLNEIGEFIGGKDHASVLYAHGKVESDMSIYKDTTSTIDDLMSKVYAALKKGELVVSEPDKITNRPDIKKFMPKSTTVEDIQKMFEAYPEWYDYMVALEMYLDNYIDGYEIMKEREKLYKKSKRGSL